MRLPLPKHLLRVPRTARALSAAPEVAPAASFDGAAAPTSSPYPHMLSPLQLRSGHTLRNRVIMGSMHSGLEEGGHHKELAAYLG